MSSMNPSASLRNPELQQGGRRLGAPSTSPYLKAMHTQVSGPQPVPGQETHRSSAASVMGIATRPTKGVFEAAASYSSHHVPKVCFLKSG